jgi:hypothetical protein
MKNKESENQMACDSSQPALLLNVIKPDAITNIRENSLN